MIRAGVALLVLLAIGSAPGATLLCAWSCAASHHPAETSHHHDCDEPSTSADRLASDVHCGDHFNDATAVAIGSITAYSAPTFGSGALISQAIASDQAALLVVTPRGAGRPLPRGPSILRI